MYQVAADCVDDTFAIHVSGSSCDHVQSACTRAIHVYLCDIDIQVRSK